MRVVIDDQPKKEVVAAVMRLWNVGLDTERIAKTIKAPESQVERWLHYGLNRRFIERKAVIHKANENG